MGITKSQWQTVCLNLLGLRSEDNKTEIKSAASYAMDCAKKWSDSIPENWDDLLAGTIQSMKAFSNYKNRYLLIVSTSTGSTYGSSNASEYDGCFPKCSSKPTQIKACTSLDQTEEALVQWVLDNIK